MFSLSHHPGSTAVSFQEAHALRPLLKEAGRPSSVNSSIFTRFPIVTDLLRRSLTMACANNDAFLTRFSVDAQCIFQREIISLSGAEAYRFQEVEAGDSLDDPAVTEQIAAYYKTSFEFADEHWLRVLLLRTRDGSSLLVFRTPHLISDSASVRLFITEMWGYYEALTHGETPVPVPARFSLQDYAASQQAWAQTAEFERQLEGLLLHTQKGMDLLSQRAADTPHRALPSRPGAFRLSKLPQTVQDQIKDLATRLKVSPSLLLMASTVVFFGRFSAQRDFCFRMPFSGRVANGTDRIMGFLSNDLPMFVSLREDDTFQQLVRRIQQESMSVMRYGSVPWNMLTARLGKSHSVTPFDDYLINIIPAVEHFGQAEALRAKSFPLPITGKTNSILKVLMYVLDSGSSVTLKVGEEDQDRLEQFLMPDFTRVLARLTTAPELPLAPVLHSPEYS